MNIKNPLFTLMADFLFGEVGKESAENLIDGADGEQSYWFVEKSVWRNIDGEDGKQSPPSCRQKSCKYASV